MLFGNRKVQKHEKAISRSGKGPDNNGEIEFAISSIDKGIDWVAWAIRNENGKFEFKNKAYDEGRAWGMFVEVK